VNILEAAGVVTRSKKVIKLYEPIDTIELRRQVDEKRKRYHTLKTQRFLLLKLKERN
jgi:hypothetical protein